jgi:cell wall-associated protease
MKRKKRIFNILVLWMVYIFSSIYLTQAQSAKYSVHGWQLQDYRTDSVFGASVNKAYRDLLRNKKAHPVIVAVIDGGADTAHEDLVGHFWTNVKEIPGNGIDDDHNGYVDDIHGWNFLGGKDGRNIIIDSYESSREYYRLKNITPEHTHADSLYREKVKKYFLKDSTQVFQMVSTLVEVLPEMQTADSIFKIWLDKDSVYARDVMEFEPADSSSAVMKKNTLMFFRKNGIATDMSLGWFIREAKDYQKISLELMKNFSGDPNAGRIQIVGDDFNNINDRNYGNNNIAAGTPNHGTHVAGIIAATRGNGKGMDGVDAHVFIMVIRAVPEGDERDKDVALAIRYAVDNKARIINMSFGKYLSPGKKWVDDAVRYAEEHDVLIVNAAGNEYQNIDSVRHYPSPVYDGSGRNSCCWLSVGANTGGPDSLVVGRYSNYGKNEVDLFAPGARLYSTLPDNQYAAYSGTSMASPMVTGIAALLLEYYPLLSARQLKYILTHSVFKLPENWVRKPGGGMVDFNQLSASAGIVNAYNALRMAAGIKGERKPAELTKVQGHFKN